MMLIWFIQNNFVSLLYKELIMPYKPICGIYKITNTVNNKYYIGSAISIRYRLNTHKRLLKDNKHFNNHLQASYNKYGLSNFIFEQLEVTTKKTMIEKEQYWIDQLDATNSKKGYNKRIIASSNLGIKLSEQTRKKLSVAHIGHKRSKEAQLKISASQYIPICQFSLDGKYIQTFNSLQEASIYLNKNYTTSITACLQRKIPSALGYTWCYKKDKDIFKPLEHKLKRSNSKKIQVLNIKTNKVYTFKSLTEASNYFKVPISSISTAISKQKKYKNHIWKKV